MASTPTPPPHCSSIPARPSTNATANHRHSHHNHHHRHHQNNNSNYLKRQENSRWSASSRYSSSRPLPLPAATGNGAVSGSVSGVPSAAASAAAAATGTAPPAAFSSSMSSFLGARNFRLAPEFSGRRSTRFVSKMHSGRPRAGTNNHRHSTVADEALRCLLKVGDNAAAIDNVLLSFENRLSWAGDYTYLIREFGNEGQYLLATKCYDFAMGFEDGAWLGKEKLTSSMISTLGRLGKVEDALRLFEYAKIEGYGNNMYSHSSMISAFGHNGRFHDALSVFRSMRSLGLEPNLITYNVMIDAGAKGEVGFHRVVKFFEEMVANGVKPDRVTYNSLLSACVPGGLWEVAKNLLTEMEEKGLGHDAYSYNTYLHALCKGGQMDMAWKVMEEMPAMRIFPNVVTYSTMMDGYGKAGRLEDALHLYDEMRRLSIPFDRVSYNTLVAVYAKLGWFEEAFKIIEVMESCGITKDVVTYNALLCGFGKHGMYDEVRRTFKEMKENNRYPNILTYSTMINVYTKGRMYREAMDIYREFKQEGFEIDVVFYSALIDALCKNGLADCGMMLLDAMTKEGIRPNIVTYNSIIDAYGQALALECGVDTSIQANDHRIEHSSSQLVMGSIQNQVTDKENDQIMSIFEQLASATAVDMKKDKSIRQDNFSILWLFQKMHELEIKPNVVTFSAILNACSHCNSFGDASKLLDGLCLFDNQVYGVAHGLLMGYRETIWFEAQALFDEIKRMDSSTASAFYNALTDMLWHFGQKRGAQLVVLEGKRRNAWKGDWSDSCLDLHLMSCGAACAMVHTWLLDIRSVVFEGSELPKILSILTGWGKHSKVVGNGTLKRAVEELLNRIGAPFRIAEHNIGRFISPGYVLAAWLRQSSTMNVLVLHDVISNSGRADQVYNLQTLCI